MKAQTASQIFVYLLTIVVVGVILLFGYRSITEFKSKTETASMIKFQKSLESTSLSIANQFGTVQKKDFPLSTEFTEICFVRNYQLNTQGLNFNTVFLGYPLIQDEIESNSDQNIFLLKGKQIAQSFALPNIIVDNNGPFYCIDNDGTLSLTFEGKGNHVVIS